MERVFNQYNLFQAKNYMEGLNKIVDEIGEQMVDPFKVSRVEAKTRQLPV